MIVALPRLLKPALCMLKMLCNTERRATMPHVSIHPAIVPVGLSGEIL